MCVCVCVCECMCACACVCCVCVLCVCVCVCVRASVVQARMVKVQTALVGHDVCTMDQSMGQCM